MKPDSDAPKKWMEMKLKEAVEEAELEHEQKKRQKEQEEEATSNLRKKTPLKLLPDLDNSLSTPTGDEQGIIIIANTSMEEEEGGSEEEMGTGEKDAYDESSSEVSDIDEASDFATSTNLHFSYNHEAF